MERNVRLVTSLALLAAAVTCHPVGTETKHGKFSNINDILRGMTQMTTGLLAQTASNTQVVASQGDTEMRISGFTVVVTIPGDGDSELQGRESKTEKKDRLTELGYELINGRYYKYHDGGVDWWTANRTCAEEGAYLVIINSIEEAHLVGRIFSRHPASDTDYPSQLYVGLNDLANEGEFVTIFGDSIRETGYVNWRRGQPSNNKDNNPAGENCVSIFRLLDLNDIYCNAKLAFICEATVE